MAKRICSRPECNNESNCKGLCRKHYKAMRRAEGYRDPLRGKQCRKCNAPFRGRHDQNFCSSSCRVAHSNASREPRPKAPEKGPHCKILHASCIVCLRSFNYPLGDKRAFCSPACQDKAEELAKPRCRRCNDPRPRHATYCAECKVVLKREGRRRTVRKAREEGKGWASLTNHRRRAKHYGVEYQSITPRDIYQRDGWTCGICLLPVDPDIKYPDAMSASLDHILPMLHGGGHVPDNVQCAHFLCNSLKGGRPWGTSMRRP